MIKGAKATLLYQVEGTVVWKNGAMWCILNGWSITGFSFPNSGKAVGLLAYFLPSIASPLACFTHPPCSSEIPCLNCSHFKNDYAPFLHLRLSWFLLL